MRNVIGLGLELHQHDIDLLASTEDDARGPDLGLDGELPIRKAHVQSLLSPVWICNLVIGGLGEILSMCE